MDYELKTKLGNVKISPNNADHVYVGFPELIVFGVAYSGNIRLMRSGFTFVLETSSSDRSGFNSLYISQRWNGKTFLDASHAARNKIKEIVIPAVAEFLKSHPEALTDAAKQDLQNQIDRQAAKVADLTKELAAAQKELNALKSLR
jgi:hypothetical protein